MERHIKRVPQPSGVHSRQRLNQYKIDKILDTTTSTLALVDSYIRADLLSNVLLNCNNRDDDRIDVRKCQEIWT